MYIQFVVESVSRKKTDVGVRGENRRASVWERECER